MKSNKTAQIATIAALLATPAVFSGCMDTYVETTPDEETSTATVFGHITDGTTGTPLPGHIIRIITPDNVYEEITDNDEHYNFSIEITENPEFFPQEAIFEVDDDNVPCDGQLTLEQCVGEYYKYSAPIVLEEGNQRKHVSMIPFDPMEDTPHYEDNLTYINTVKSPLPEENTGENILSAWNTYFPLYVEVHSQINDAPGWNGLTNEHGVDFEEAVIDAMAAWNEGGEFLDFYTGTCPNYTPDIVIDIFPTDDYFYAEVKTLADDTSIFHDAYITLPTVTETQEQANIDATYALGKALGHLGTHIGYDGGRGEAEDYIMSIGAVPNKNELDFIALSTPHPDGDLHPPGLLDRNLDHYLRD